MNLETKHCILLAHAAKPHVYQQLPQEHSFSSFGTPAATYGAPDVSSSPDSLAPAAPELSAVDMPLEDSYNAAYRHSSTQHHQTGYDNGPTETQVHKHIYVHVPPKDFEDEDAIQPRVIHQGGPKQKHYKIVFIKAPAAPTMRAPIVPPAPQNEEKTLIYVLHKKPEAQADIVIPTPAPTKPSKPEVYFIKYKTKKDEAPVYGPPPATSDAQPRQDVEGSFAENNEFMPMDFATTPQPAHEQEQPLAQPHFVNEQEQADPMNNYISEDPQSTNAAEPLNQYLPPETTPAPIVVEDIEEPVHVPAATYGPPNQRSRFFIKKRK